MNYQLRKLQMLCKAANDVSGNVPGNSPSGMSLYERTIETLTTLFPLWVCLLLLFFCESDTSAFELLHFVLNVMLYLVIFWRALPFNFKFSTYQQVILGTIIGIYKPAAVITSLLFFSIDDW